MRSPRTVSRRVGEQLDHGLDAETAAPRARPAGVGEQPSRAHDERELRLERLDLGDHRAAAEEERAGGIGAVGAVAGAEPTELVEEREPRGAVGVRAAAARTPG